MVFCTRLRETRRTARRITVSKPRAPRGDSVCVLAGTLASPLLHAFSRLDLEGLLPTLQVWLERGAGASAEFEDVVDARNKS